MKKINLPLSTKISIPISNTGKSNSFTVGPHVEKVDTAMENAKTVIFSTTQIEHDMESLISAYLFGQEYEESKSFFDNEILKTNFFTFSTKKRIVLSLIKKLILLEGKNYSSLEQSLNRIMNYRNAFAHGEIVSSVAEGVILRYFSSEQKEDVLSDEYWTSLEETFKKGKELLGISKDKFCRERLKG